MNTFPEHHNAVTDPQKPGANDIAALVPIVRRDDKSAVSARELYAALGGAADQFNRWLKANVLNNQYAVEGEDYSPLHRVDKSESEGLAQGRPSEDCFLTIPFAKKLAMLTRTQRGEAVRDYFIECERRLLAAVAPAPPDLSDPLVTAGLLHDATARFMEAERARREAQRQLVEQAPAVAFARKVELSPVDVNIGTFAKIIGWKPNKLHEELRRRGYMFRRGTHPVPKQTYVEQGLFTVKEVPVGSRVYPVTTLTGKGQLRLARELGVNAQPALLLETTSV